MRTSWPAVLACRHGIEGGIVMMRSIGRSFTMDEDVSSATRAGRSTRSGWRLLPLLGLVVVSVAVVALGAGSARAVTGPAVSFSPSSLTFASQDTGTTSAPQTITATNTGSASVFFNNVATSGDSLGFTVVDHHCLGASPQPGGGC